MTHLPLRVRLPVLAAFLVFGVGTTAGCGDDIFAIDWVESPDTVVLYSLALPELNLTSGFDFYNRRAVTIEDPDATGNWDFAVDTRAGALVLLPPGALGVNSKAQVAPLVGQTFAEVTEAPADTTLYVRANSVPVALGTVYVWRTRQGFGSFGRSCVYYAKMEALALDAGAGRLTFQFDASPVCNDRSLIPPK
jgi:hypothetical protein